MVKIVHTSDLHGSFYKLPDADMYIVTGDMLMNYPDIIEHTHNGIGMGGHFGGGWSRFIDHDKEERLQNGWFEKKFKNKGRTLRHFLGNPDAPVIVVRGNHDFVPLAPMFGGEVYEIGDPNISFDVLGFRIGGFRGINHIAGEWSDEKTKFELRDAISELPDNLDIILTHSPPYNILDGKFGEKWGIEPYASWIEKMQYRDWDLPKLFCFGHVHCDNGIKKFDDGTIFSNAATTHQIIEL